MERAFITRAIELKSSSFSFPKKRVRYRYQIRKFITSRSLM